VLQPLVIHTAGGQRILEAKLRKSSREVINLSLNTSRLEAGEVEIDWNILERNDGGVLQIVYVGDESVDIAARAVIEGQQEIVRRTPSAETPMFKSERSKYSPILSMVFIVVNLVVLSLQAIGVTRRISGQSHVSKMDRLVQFALWAAVIGFSCAVVYYIRMFVLGASPFD